MKIRRNPQQKPTGVLSASFLLALFALALAGCGGSSTSSTSTASTTKASNSAAAAGAPFAGKVSPKVISCLKEQGAELPSAPQGGQPSQGAPPPGGPPSGANRGKLQEAFKRCGVQMPAGGPGKTPNPAAYKSSIQAYVACVRKHGYAMPEPNLSGKGPVFNSSAVNQNDPKFKAASEKCQSSLRPQGGPGEG